MSSSPQSDFGTYLASVQERDIDLLLMEEFHVSSTFTRWFAESVGISEATFDGAWHSVTDADGETDLLLRVRAHGHRIALLIENKISAAEQSRQDERYHLRAARAQNEGKYDAFVTCMCAPQAYLDTLSASSLYQSKLPYELVVAWFGRFDDARSCWRKAVLEQAITQSRRGYSMIVNERVSAFHMAFWRFLQTNHPKLLMRRPTSKGNKSKWILFKGAGFPKYVGFHIKLDQSVVELGFVGRSSDELIGLLKLPPEVFVVQKGGTAALSIAVPKLVCERPLEEQMEALESVMAAVWKLAPYADVLELAEPL